MTYAVVEVLTMMIKLIRTPITLTTMFTATLHSKFTNITVQKFLLIAVKNFPEFYIFDVNSL